jgi:monooxygenase
MSNDFDVIVVGAGLSGIGAAYRLKTECPHKRFVIFEARDAIGGTWDLFRYPGVRSDSDMFTLSYPFHPWSGAKAIADGPSILAYIRDTARTFGIEPHIRFRHRIGAAHVTMLQRSPTYYASRPDRDPIADFLRAKLPAQLAHQLVRNKNIVLGMAFYQFCRRFPNAASKLLRAGVAKLLPADYPVDRHFTPRYKPWDQRLCLVPDADMFKAISAGKVSVVTDTIAEVTATGVTLASGEALAAEILVLATGLTLVPWGGVALEVDGKPLAARDTLVYKGMMLSDVPNFAWCVGYTNASWTLRADLTSRNVCQLLNHMDDHGYVQVTPHADGRESERRPLLDLSSSYIERAADLVPSQGSKAPWYLRQNYVLDWWSTRFGKVGNPSLQFTTRSATRASAKPAA